MGWADIGCRLALIMLAGVAAQAGTSFSAPADVREVEGDGCADHDFVRIRQGRLSFDLNKREDLNRLENAVDRELQDTVGSWEDGALKKRIRRGLKEIHRLTKALLVCNDAQQTRRLKMMLTETAAAKDNLRRSPLPESVDFFQTPGFFLERLSRPVGRGHNRAGNIQAGIEPDLSRLDPEPSTFWCRPQSIFSQDLYHGFGRNTILLESEPLCSYAGPKESFGRNPGFEIECDGMKLKLKFAEVSSEPFAARIFDSLGYHADPTDYAPRVRVRYSRRIFEEFNLRKSLHTHFKLAGFIHLYTLELQGHYDPFDYVHEAVLTDGTRWTGAQLKNHLLRDPNLKLAEMDPRNYRPEVEDVIDYLETVPANVQRRMGKSIGPWDFGQLDHASRRELRGAGLLAAWLGWFDTRADNTRLRIVEHNGQRELEHYFSDLGGVLGETSGMLYARGELPNAFPWTFTRPPLWQGEHRLARPLRLTGYKPLESNPAFAAMTIDDARWMARLIGALRQEQIEQALIASGFDSAQVQLYSAKLLSRRDQMIADLGLAGEFPVLAGPGEKRDFCYNPRTDGPLRVQIEGALVEAPAGTHRIVNGKLIPSGSQSPSTSQARMNTANGFSF